MNDARQAPNLVAVDFSAESRTALVYSAGSYAGKGRAIVVLHVVHDDGASDRYRRRVNESPTLPIHDIAERVMHDFINEVRDEHADIEALKAVRTVVASATHCEQSIRRQDGGTSAMQVRMSV